MAVSETASLGQPEHVKVSNNRLNWLRAAVLGANDGIVSVASIILGVAGATTNRTAIFTAGVAGLSAGALSMAIGEYVSVSSQRDTERAYIAEEKWHLERHPEEEFEDLVRAYEAKGLSHRTARQVAEELSARDAVKAHLDAELGINEADLNNPVLAAAASLAAFAVGGAIPLIATMVAGRHERLVATFIAVVVALVITGYLSATIGQAPRLWAVVRVVAGGAAAMLVTYGVGHVFGQIVH
jgi:VIT1/CCC1 family predicted Fe2+/Mn2+ transporter